MPEPVAGSGPIKLRTEKRWRPALFTIGALCVIGSMLLGLLIYRSVTTTSPVLVTANDILPGETLQESDLVIVDMTSTGNVELIEASEQDSASLDLYNRVSIGPIPAGTPINADMFVDPESFLGSNESRIAIEVNAGSIPADLTVGDELEILAPKPEAGAEDAVSAVGWGIVHRVEPEGENNRTITLVIDNDYVVPIVRTLLDGTFHIVVKGGG